MPNLLKWVLAGVGLFVAMALVGIYKPGDFVTAVVGLAGIAWVIVGLLLTVRRTLRFLRQ